MTIATWKRNRVLPRVLPGSQEDERFQTYLRPPMSEHTHCLQTGNDLSQSCNWFTTIVLKDTYFLIEAALKHRKFLCFTLQAVKFLVGSLHFQCVEIALQAPHKEILYVQVSPASAAQSKAVWLFCLTLNSRWCFRINRTLTVLTRRPCYSRTKWNHRILIKKKKKESAKANPVWALILSYSSGCY